MWVWELRCVVWLWGKSLTWLNGILNMSFCEATVLLKVLNCLFFHVFLGRCSLGVSLFHGSLRWTLWKWRNMIEDKKNAILSSKCIFMVNVWMVCLSWMTYLPLILPSLIGLRILVNVLMQLRPRFEFWR